jgi:hypothetical protein
MADNIKIVGNILNTTTVSRYSSEDTNLISSRILQENFGETNDYIEVYLYNVGNNLLNINYNYLDYKLPYNANLKPNTDTLPNTTGNIQTDNIGIVSTFSDSTSPLYPIIEIDPVMDIQNYGYSSGEFIIKYNLFTNKLSDNANRALFIKEISADRTEIRLASTKLSNDEIELAINSIIDEINSLTYYADYLLNFGNNEQYVVVNVALNKATTGYEVLLKLYKPLPLSVQEKRTSWIVEEKSESYTFDVNLDKLITPQAPPTLRGPNFSSPIENQGTVSTAYGTYSNLISSLQNKSYHQVLNLMATQSADVNIDYTNFNNFVFFGSAKQRVVNFYTKAKQIEGYNTLISTYTPQTASIPSLITEINQYTSNIKDITTQFDGYEYYLYFESSSYAWPKSGSLKPYSLLSTGSISTTTWYNNLILVAEDYDQNNYDNLEFSIPPFLTEDDTNAPFLLFLNMIGNYFDDIWVYIKSVTDLNLANNNLDYGISKDLVYERLKSLGIKLYNSQAGESVGQYLIGANTGSSIFNNNFTITGSYLNNIPRKDLTSELYKRIYHNLPLLVKTKGTVAGLEHLNTIFGITSSILNVKEFGGSTKAELINGYNNDKVRIVQNTITGSVLSSMLSLQTFPTASSAFRDNDMHYVDISFSPQTQIDTYISGAVNLNNPTWSLDDYIGDPRQQYNNSYSDLATQRNLYHTSYSTTSSIIFNSASLASFITPTGSFIINGITIAVTGSTRPANTATTIFISSGSTSTNTIGNITASFNVSKSISPYSTALQYITASASSSNGLFFNATTYGVTGNTYYITSGSTTTYFSNGYSPFTSSLLDYNGFIRLIDYFDNSLFKMLADFTPERTSLSTGVTINSPVLERNKTSFANPTTSNTQSVYTAQFNTASITPQYSPLYNNLTGDKKPYFTGELSGSVVDVHQYFTDNYNQYLGDWDVYNSQHTISQSIDLNSFNHSDWNVLLNNVSKNVTSNKRKGIEYIYGTTGSITSSVELQDSNLSLRSYQISRYEGSKLTSATYNTYTSASSTYVGDISYGKTAVIDHQSLKVGWVKNIPSQSLNLYDKTTIDLKYLVDSSTSLIELSLANNNICEVQNIFKSGTPIILSISDIQKPSNQTNLNGLKTIFRGGYSYDPILYREVNETLTFTHTNAISSTERNLGVKAICKDIFYYNAEEHDGSVDTNLRNCQPSKNSDGSKGGNGVNGGYFWSRTDSTISTIGTPMAYRSYDFNNWPYKNYSNAINTTAQPNTGIRGGGGPQLFIFNLLNFNNTDTIEGGYNNETISSSYSPLGNNGNYYYKVPRDSTYNLSGSIPFSFYGDDTYDNGSWFGSHTAGGGPVGFKIFGLVQKTTTPNNENSWWAPSNLLASSSLSNNNGNSQGIISFSSNYNQIVFDNTTNWSLFYCQLNAKNISLKAGEYVRFQFVLMPLTNIFGINDDYIGVTTNFSFYINGTTNNSSIQITPAFFEIKDQGFSYTEYNYTTTYSQIPSLFTTASSNTIAFDPTAQSLINSDAIFTPTAPASNYYSPVVDYFGIQKQDLLRIGQFNNPNPVYYEVLNTYTTSGQTFATLDRTIDTGSFNNAVSFAILRPKPDETSVIINYRKQLGDVSQTILIPYDANNTIKNNVGNIFKTLNTNLK